MDLQRPIQFYLGLLMVLCVIVGQEVWAQPVLTLSDGQDSYPLGHYLMILEDPDANLTIDDVSSPKYASQFQPSQQAVPIYGFTQSAYWARLKLKNNSTQHTKWLFEQNFANTHYLDLYLPTADGKIFTAKKSGNLRPTSTRDLKHRLTVFKVTAPTGSEQTLFIRILNGASMTLDFNLWPTEAFAAKSLNEAHIMGLFYGVFIIMFFYNLFIFVSLREASHGYLLLLIATLGGAISLYDGYLQYLFSDTLLHLSDDFFKFLFLTTSFSLLLFTRKFLPFDKPHPLERQIQTGMIVYYCALYLPAFFLHFTTMGRIIMASNLVMAIFLIYRGISSLRDGNMSARFYLGGWIFFMLTFLAVQGVRNGLIESNVFTEQGVRLGWVWLVLSMSLALADRINRLKHQKKTMGTALNQSEARFRSLEESQIIGIIEADLEGNITRANDIFLDMTGYKRKDLPMRWDKMTPENWKARDEIAVQQLQSTGTATPWEKEYICKNGSLISVMVGATTLDTRSGDTIAFVLDLTEQKHTESALNISQAMLLLLFEHANDGISVIVDGYFTDCNQKLLDQLKLQRNEVIGKSPTELSPAIQSNGRDSLEYADEIIQKALSGKQLIFEWTHLCGDDSITDFEISTSVVELSGKITLFSYMRDITERKTAENALRNSEERFNKAFHSSPDSVTITRASDGKIIEANEGFERVCGYSRSQVIGRSTIELDLWVDQGLRSQFVDILKRNGNVKDFAMQVNNPHYGARDCLLSCEMMDVDGDPCLLTIARDVTEQKRAENALIKSEIKFATAFKSSPDIIGITDLESGKVIELNDSFEKIIGYKINEVIGQKTTDLDIWCNPSDRDNVIQELRKNGHVADQEYEFKKKNDEIFIGLFSSELIKLEQRNYMLVNIRDITERKRAEQDLFRANKEVTKLKEQLEEENFYLQEEIKSEHNFDEIIGDSPALKKVLAEVENVAPTDASVLIYGESGTGKELIARAIHHISPRKDRAIVIVNCGAIPTNLVESELFGHEKGAFTGATSQRKGRFELANGGTIFLDEVAELPLETQVKLLRVLQEQEFERVGGSETIKVDVRVISASNQDFGKIVEDGKFRPDLFYRLNVFPIAVPPLRDRAEDIQLLIMHFLHAFNKKIGKQIKEVSSDAMQHLCAYHWPGNIRELKNIIERAVIISKGTKLRINNQLLSNTNTSSNNDLQTLDEIERKHILLVLDFTNKKISGNKGAADILGINPNTLRSRMQKLGIK